MSQTKSHDDASGAVAAIAMVVSYLVSDLTKSKMVDAEKFREFLSNVEKQINESDNLRSRKPALSVIELFREAAANE